MRRSSPLINVAPPRVRHRRPINKIAARLALIWLSFVWLPAAFAANDPWRTCRGAEPDARIAACSRIIAKGGQRNKRGQVEAYVNRAAAYRAKSDVGRALADLDKALKLDPKSAAALEERATLYLDKNDFDAAISDNSVVIASRPTDVAAFYGRGEAYRAKNDLERAIADYDKALHLDPGFEAAYAGRAKAFRAKGDIDKALADFTEAVKLTPQSPALRIERGDAYQAKGDLNLALADYDAALELDPRLADARDSRGLVFLAKGDFDKAVEDFSAAIELDPSSARALLNRARAYRSKGDVARARQDLQAALRLDPQLAAAQEALGALQGSNDKKAAPPASGERRARPSPLESVVLFRVGPVPVTRPVATTWAIMLFLSLGSWLMTRGLRSGPGRRQAVLELLLTGIMSQIEDVIRKDSRPFLPLVGTLFIFLVAANLSPMLPGVEAPTSKLETPAALALIVFFSVHYYGMRTRGLLGYLASFAEPKLIMLPLNIVSEVTRTFSLMVRLFGNVMSGEFVIGLVLTLAGLFVPIPFMLIEILLGIIQAYIFTVLAIVFIGAAIGSVEKG